MTVITCRFASGSSPPVRGAQYDGDNLSLRLGLIPARAGNTACYLWASGWTGAHPRSRGEHMGFPSVPSLDMGSSPPVRGALSRVHGNDPAAGLIPACAGSTPMSRLVSAPCWAHPRLCGEHVYGFAQDITFKGSSPPVRGAPNERRFFIKQLRAHPRLCGEHNPAVGAGIKIMGSSPPVRGALISLSSISTSPGLIPACAGSTARHKP